VAELVRLIKSGYFACELVTVAHMAFLAAARNATDIASLRHRLLHSETEHVPRVDENIGSAWTAGSAPDVPDGDMATPGFLLGEYHLSVDCLITTVFLAGVQDS